MFIFEIFSKPVVQKQTQFVRRGAFVHSYDPSRKDREQIAWQIKPFAPENPLSCPVSVEITFYLPMPKATSKVKQRQMINNVLLPIKRPDIDNMAYIFTNAMKEIVYQDDSQIVDLVLKKRYAENPKTVIRVIPIQTSEKLQGTA